MLTTKDSMALQAAWAIKKYHGHRRLTEFYPKVSILTLLPLHYFEYLLIILNLDLCLYTLVGYILFTATLEYYTRWRFGISADLSSG